MLLNEEMRRAIQYTNWLANWWESQANLRANVPEEVREGLRAYAAEHAALERRLSALWEAKWAAVRALATQYLSARGLLLNPRSQPTSSHENEESMAVVEVQVKEDDVDDSEVNDDKV